MTAYFGLKELRTFIANKSEPEFDVFIEENKNNIAIWSVSTKSNSATNLFALWKNRFQKAWTLDPVKKKTRCPNISMRNSLPLWMSIENMVQQIKITKDEYAIQAMNILRSMSSLSTNILLQAIEQEATNERVSGSEEKAQKTEEVPNEEANSGVNSSTSTSDHNRVSSSNICSTYEFKEEYISIPSTQNRYTIGQFDVSLTFYIFQLISGNHFNTLNIESNVSQVLALSSIFLIQRNKWHPALIGAFTEEKLNDVFDDQCKQYSIRKYIRKKINNTEIITNIIKDFKNDIISREEGIVKLYTLGFSPSLLSVSTRTTTAETSPSPITMDTLRSPTLPNVSAPSQQQQQQQQAPLLQTLPLPRNLNKLLKCMAKLVEKLPNEDIKEDVLEFELCQRYIDPILSGLFDYPDKGILFRWTSITNEESKHGYITKQRPDSVITQLDGLYYGASLGFVEVKSAKQGNDKFAISNDLVRLGLLSKNSIDCNNARGCLAIQVIGLNIKLFITRLMADGMYTMLHVYSIKIPSSKESVPGFVGYLDELLAVLDIFDEYCLTSNNNDDGTNCKRKSLPDEAFNEILSRSKSNKRRCYTS